MTIQALTTQAPDVLQAIALCPRLAPSTKAQYHKALSNYLATGASLADAGALADYARDLPTSSKAFLKAAVRIVAERARAQMNACADPGAENAIELEARMSQADRRFTALQDAIEVKTPQGQKAHVWLSASEVRQLFATCDDSLKGQRDRVVLALLVGAGLRRAEACSLTFADIVLQPRGDRMRTVLQVCGKGNKNRVVPISDRMANLLDEWAKIAGDGRILRSLDQAGNLNSHLSSTAVFRIVRSHGAQISKPALSPHDLRRSYSQLGLDAGVPLTQISVLLGHASVQTTQKYLCMEIDLTTTISDFVPVE